MSPSQETSSDKVTQPSPVQESSILETQPVQLVFNYLVPRIGNGFQTKVPNLKSNGLILQQIEFDFGQTSKRPELEVVLNHGGTSLKYFISYFQIFDRINLSDYWHRLTDGDDVELIIRNKSNQQQDLKVTYTYAESSGVIIHSSSLRAGDLKESPILTDLTNGWLPQKLYLKSESQIKNLSLVPKFQFQSQNEQSIGDYQLVDLDQNEVLLDFNDEDLADIYQMLSYYRLEVDFADPEQTLYLLAYGFKR